MLNREKIAILVDSGSDVPPELRERYHIFMIPLKILFHEAAVHCHQCAGREV